MNTKVSNDLRQPNTKNAQIALTSLPPAADRSPNPFPTDKLALGGTPMIDVYCENGRYVKNVPIKHVSNGWFKVLDLRWVNSAYCSLQTLDLSGADMTGAILTGANLSGVNLIGTNLTGANLENAFLTNARLSGAILVNANLQGASLKGAFLNGAFLNGANLTRANLLGANLVNATLYGANFSKANLGERTDFRYSNYQTAINLNKELAERRGASFDYSYWHWGPQKFVR